MIRYKQDPVCQVACVPSMHQTATYASAQWRHQVQASMHCIDSLAQAQFPINPLPKNQTAVLVSSEICNIRKINA